MANEITRLLPFRQYDENDVVNFYSFDGETGQAGSVVKVKTANLTDEPVKYVQRGDSDSFQTTLGKGLSMYPEVPYKVEKATDTGVSRWESYCETFVIKMKMERTFFTIQKRKRNFSVLFLVKLFLSLREDCSLLTLRV